MSKREVEVIEKTRAFQGYFAVDRYRLRHTQFAGDLGQEIQREIFERGHAAAVIPYDPVLDRVVLIEQFRPGVFAKGDPNPWMIEIVAGIIDEGETAEDVCRREAVEEAGVEISRLEHLSTQFMSPGGCSETVALYVGLCDCRGAGGVHGLDEEGEDIRVFTAAWSEVLAMALDGRIRNALSTVALLQLHHRREDLRRAWS